MTPGYHQQTLPKAKAARLFLITGILLDLNPRPTEPPCRVLIKLNASSDVTHTLMAVNCISPRHINQLCAPDCVAFLSWFAERAPRRLQIHHRDKSMNHEEISRMAMLLAKNQR
jgi:hypothetical protein